jgi:hypothetical protein
VIERVKDFCHVVGLSCDGFEGKMLKLFAEIEEIRYLRGMRQKHISSQG